MNTSANSGKGKLMGGIFVTVAAITYGILPFFSRIALDGGANAYTLTFARFLISTVTLLIICPFVKDMHLKINRRELLQLLGLALLYAITPIILTISYYTLDTSLATMLHFVNPIFVILIMAVFFKEKITGRKILCAVLCFVGVGLISNPTGNIDPVGAILAILSGLTYGGYVAFLGKSIVQDMHILTATFWISVFSMLLQLIVGIPQGQFPMSLDLGISPAGWGGAAFMGIFSTVLAVSLFQKGTILIGSVRASLIGAVEPLTSILAGILLLDENMTLLIGIGMFAILLSVTLINLPEKTKKTLA